MIIIFKTSATQDQVAHVVEKVQELKLNPMVARGTLKTVINVLGDEEVIREAPLQTFPGVEKVIPVMKKYKLVSREGHDQKTVVQIGENARLGDGKLSVIAGPCSVESRDQLFGIAGKVVKSGAIAVRGGAFKPRTSPYSFQGLGEEGLKYLQEMSQEFSVPCVTEVMDNRDVDLVVKYADVLQVGARNMQNFSLLKQLGQCGKPVILKRGMSATIEDLLQAAEYIAASGNLNIVLCERGIRTFETAIRNSFDVSSVPVLKSLTHLPIIIDPSHAAGVWEYVAPLAFAGVAAGADGVIVEVHEEPEKALSDGPQALLPAKFESLMLKMNAIADIVKEG
ncbi:3-deoxy-7-phosphoheptulonate synthase [PVC group bacterium (ex Bugula neritina AB1)]|nr:3-deoxy-7-phosphoheptulonate synthase [PVC group bacterium (ex Bugula neritina AB1)]